MDKNSVAIYSSNEFPKYYWGNTHSEVCYICFGGIEIINLFENCNIHDGVFKCENSAKVLRMYENLINACEIASTYQKGGTSKAQAKCKLIKAITLLVTFICEISENINDVYLNPTAAQTMELIHSHYNEKISLEEIAKKERYHQAKANIVV